MFGWNSLSKRWQLIFLLHTGFIIEYCLRVNASVAVVKMKEQFGWDEYREGLLLSSFYWGYASGQLPSNYIIQRTGAAKWAFAFSIITASTLTILLPIIAHSSYHLCLVFRAGIGIAESAAFPAAFNLYPKWIPPNEQTLMITCVMSGLYMGEILCFLLSGYLVVWDFQIFNVQMGSWESVFWVFGCIGLLWSPLWIRYAYESPSDHPYISTEELTMLTRSRHTHEVLSHTDPDDTIKDKSVEMSLQYNKTPHSKQTQNDNDNKQPCVSQHQPLLHETGVLNVSTQHAPWLAFAIHPTAVTLIVCYWTQNWIGYLLLSELPTFFTEELGFSLTNAGVLSMLPYVAQFLSTLTFGAAFQWLQENKGWSTRNVRQWAQYICFFGSSGCLLLCGFTSNVTLAIFAMIFSLAFYGSCQSGIACAFLDVSPRYSSTLNSCANVFGSLAGVTTPIVVAAFNERYPGPEGWRRVFMLTFAQCVVASIMWYHYQTSSIVPVLNNPSNRLCNPAATSMCQLWCSNEMSRL